MSIQRPKPPTGVADLHSQPGMESDGGLFELREMLESELSSDVFGQLTRFVSDDETPAEATDEYREQALEYVKTCITHRDEIRPDSLREWGDLPDKIDRITVGNWVQYLSGYDVEHDSSPSDADTHKRGKFLFFSPNTARVLEDIVIEQVQQRPIGAAKIPTKLGKDEDWVLCLYQDDNRYWYDLRGEYHNPPTVRFRGFKTNTKTRRKEYSDRFENSS